MQQVVNERSLKFFRIASVAILLAATLFYAFKSIDWRWQWDTSFIHYVDFLIDHGKVPYRDIIDMNMPGSYFIEGWAVDIFGRGDLGWRFYEYCLLTILTWAMIVIAKPHDWLAGLFAGVMFLMIHGAEGVQNSVQREEVMTVLLMTGLAFGFVALRRQSPWLMFPFGVLVWLPVSLKPTAAPVGIVFLWLAFLQLRRRHQPSQRYLIFCLAGMVTASAAILAFFLLHHGSGAFFQMMSGLLPYYATLANKSFSYMIINLIPRKAIWPLVLAALWLTWKNRGWSDWERQALAVGVCFGAVSFVAQRKGFLYHRYPMLAFLLLWMALEFTRASKLKGYIQKLGLAGLAGLLILIPGYCVSIYDESPGTPLADMLTIDLENIGGHQQLQNQVQCLDMVDGCFTALYRLELIQSTGFVSDFMFFDTQNNPAALQYRSKFFNEIRQNPPRVIIITTAKLAAEDSFDKLNAWPEFTEHLQTNYYLHVTRLFGNGPHAIGYKIFMLKDQQTAGGRERMLTDFENN